MSESTLGPAWSLGLPVLVFTLSTHLDILGLPANSFSSTPH